MPNKRTLERARKDKREGKAPTTQAGEFVREEIKHIREGKHGARSTKQAIADRLIEGATRRRRSASTRKKDDFRENAQERRAGGGFVRVAFEASAIRRRQKDVRGALGRSKKNVKTQGPSTPGRTTDRGTPDPKAREVYAALDIPFAVQVGQLHGVFTKRQ